MTNQEGIKLLIIILMSVAIYFQYKDKDKKAIFCLWSTLILEFYN